MAIKSILVAVSQYNKSLGCTDLPLCGNDLYAVKKALVDGLKANSDNIKLCGESGSVQVSDLINKFTQTIPSISEDDIFIFYFSGHGGDNALILSDGFVYLQHLVDYISKFNCKNKLVILDCCKSGQANLDNAKHADIRDDSIENFVGHGCAIMASCGATEVTGFNSSRNLSMYTSFLCDALTCRPLIRKGQKSLDAINEAIFKSINNWNKLGRGYIPEPIFRSSIGGTIFFDVEEYNPYQTETFYDENEKYIIYQVEPTHASVKRLTVKVILRSHFTDEEIADIFLEIKDKVMYREIYSTKNQELFFSGEPSRLVFGYLGFDEEDIVNSNYAYRTIWVDDTQNKDNWYRETKKCKSNK